MVTKTSEHGTRARYRAGCRCDDCREWKADDQAAYRARKRPADAAAPAVEVAPAPVVRARPQRKSRPTGAVVVEVGAPDFDDRVREAFSVRRPALGDELAQLIDDALWEARGDSATAAIVAASAIRAAGWVHRDSLGPLELLDLLEADAAIERAAREALPEAADKATRLRHELVFRGARALDNPENARYFASTVEALRKVLADLTGDEGGSSADIVEAIRNAGRDDGDGPEVGDSA
ncbi:MAG: hypothetical protein IJO71_02655 [Microbacterium sp.]|uniref:hypothetical protein n=1 Tax=Microbacterium sp. TaxID=51671 RepID=UPI0025CD9997|nr:hypothetical protein [Microbacterium sp.]MBQ9916083.1 hypothetical protein [Microbacterium sp.]